jgi:PPP family 3-phenylpropionic acid transporter
VADRLGNRRLVVQVAALGSVICYLGLFFTIEYFELLMVLVCMSFFWSASMPLVEATTLTYLGKNSSSYGRLRSWGSLGFIITVMSLGYVFDFIAIRWILWVGLSIQLGILYFSRQIPATTVIAHHTDHQPILRIVLQPHVLALFGACFLMAVAHGPYYTFFSIYLVEHGYAKSSVGALWTLGVFCEIVVFFSMPWLMRHYSLPKILIVSMVLAVIRFLLIAWQVDNLIYLFLAQILHAATFGAFHAAAVALIHHYFRGRHQSRGQALFGSITYGAGGMLGGIGGGPLWLQWGGSVMYTFSAGVAFVGVLLLLWKLNRLQLE